MMTKHEDSRSGRVDETAADLSTSEILRRLARTDRRLAKVIKKVGMFAIETVRFRHPFQTLFHSIVAQQISTRAAETIVKRVHELFPRRRTLHADDVLAVPEVQLRLAGVSGPKIAAVKDLAARTLNGTLPDMMTLQGMTDDEVRTCLTRVRGIGVWTADMFLIFHLQRPDVLPLSDHALKRSIALAYGLPALPTNEELVKLGESWRPWRSMACRCLWRYLDSR